MKLWERYGMLWERYGMTLGQYQALLRMKRGCWICGQVMKRDGSDWLRLYVDHDHKTGRVRGRLCYQCNRRLIGRRRDPALYRKAAAYLGSAFDGRKIKPPKSKIIKAKASQGATKI